MQAILMSSALAGGIGLACCQSAGAVSPNTTTTNEHVIGSETMTHMAWSANASKGAANTAKQNQGQQKSGKGKQ